jgi:hypothetical protein
MLLRKSRRRFGCFKKEFGVYPPRETLVELAKMSKAECEEDTLFGLYLWETRKAQGKEMAGYYII